MKKNLFRAVGFLVLTVLFFNVVSASAQDKIWQQIKESDLQKADSERTAKVQLYAAFSLNKTELQKVLNRAPEEFSTVSQNEQTILTLPMPNGNLERFRIQNSPIMAPELAAKYPEIQTYNGQGIDNPTATVRFDISPNGFRAMILSNEGTIYIEPHNLGDTADYISFNKRYLEPDEKRATCLVGGDVIDLKADQVNFFPDAPQFINNGANLRTYRLALAATGEYTNRFRAAGSTDAEAKASALARMNTTMNRVNGVYERELAIKMIIVANNDQIIYTDPNTDPYTNDNGSAMLKENQTNVDSVIGIANYDIGHVFSTGGGGIATLNSPCRSTKARGVTGLPNPTGDIFAIDYVAHEMGHQFGARHSYNGSSGSCDTRDEIAAYEPGSGSTIMSYAGLCSSQNTQRLVSDYFHIKSLEEITNFVTNVGTCSVNTPTGNTPPTVSLANNKDTYNIPKQTPFTLTAVGSDANNDSLTYNWEQYDLGPSSPPDTDGDGQARPIFRSFNSTASPSRTFPSLQYILGNDNVPPSTVACSTGGSCAPGESLPSINRTMNFQVTARDNRVGGGGVNSAIVVVKVDGNSGPFQVTAPNTNINWSGLSQQNITWNVANTNNAPVSVTNVRILLSTDGGQSFPTILSNSTTNDGSETITVPNITTSTARIKIEAVDNIFFDISNANFSITQGVSAPNKTPFDFDGDGKADYAIYRPSAGEWWYLRSGDSVNRAFQFGNNADRIVPADYTGDGKTDVAFFRPSTNEWFVLRSEDFSFYSAPFGAAGDIPAPADYDGDGKADFAVFRPSEANWYINRSSGGFTIVQFGATGDVPVASDFDGDSKADLAIFRPAAGEWWILRSSDGGNRAFQFGTPTDKPVPADYTGDGKIDVAFYRPQTSEWFVLRSENGSFYSAPFGAAGDIPVPADFDGDGKADIAVWRATDTNWYVAKSSGGFSIAAFGAAGDKPVPSPSN